VLGAADIYCSDVQEAVERSHIGCLQALLQQPTATAALLQVDSDQRTPLHLVQHFTAHCTATTAALIDRLTQQQQLATVINSIDSSGRTALRATVVDDDEYDNRRVCQGCMRLLLAAAADTIADAWEPDILAAVISENTACDDSSTYPELTVQALVRRGLDIDQQNSEGLTWLQQLAQYVSNRSLITVRVEIKAALMRALLANGADALATDSDINTPLHLLVNSYAGEYSRFARAVDHWKCPP
jgi:hypothetical protein